jgi:hypothetical protein
MIAVSVRVAMHAKRRLKPHHREGRQWASRAATLRFVKLAGSRSAAVIV